MSCGVVHSACGALTHHFENIPGGLETPNSTGNTPLAEHIKQLANRTYQSNLKLEKTINNLLKFGASLNINVDGMPLLEFIVENHDKFNLSARSSVISTIFERVLKEEQNL